MYVLFLREAFSLWLCESLTSHSQRKEQKFVSEIKADIDLTCDDIG